MAGAGKNKTLASSKQVKGTATAPYRSTQKHKSDHLTCVFVSDSMPIDTETDVGWFVPVSKNIMTGSIFPQYIGILLMHASHLDAKFHVLQQNA